MIAAHLPLAHAPGLVPVLCVCTAVTLAIGAVLPPLLWGRRRVLAVILNVLGFALFANLTFFLAQTLLSHMPLPLAIAVPLLFFAALEYSLFWLRSCVRSLFEDASKH